MAYVKEVEWQGRIYDLFDKEARVKIQNLLEVVNKMDSDKANQADFDSYKTTNDEELKKKVDKEDSDKIVEELKKQLADKDKAIIDLSIKNTTDKDSSCVINDSTSKKIRALTLYGNSIQSATPAPNTPADINNVTSPKIKFYHKNLFDMSVCNVYANDKATVLSIDRTNSVINFTTDGSSANSGIYLRHVNLNTFGKGYGVDYTKLEGKTVTLSVDIIANIDCKIKISFLSNNYNDLIELKASTPQHIVKTEKVDIAKLNKAICFYTDKTNSNITISNIQVEVSSTVTDYDNCDYKEISVNCQLCKVNNIVDTLTIKPNGEGYITQNLVYERLLPGVSTSGNSWKYSTASERFYRDDNRFKVNYGAPNLLCSHFKAVDNERDTSLDGTIGFTSGATTAHGIAIRKLDLNGDISAFESWLNDNEVYILVPLVTPIVTPLTADEVDAVLTTSLYESATTIISDCDCEVEYVADTKSYIDNKFKELAQVIVASADESEVM